MPVATPTADRPSIFIASSGLRETIFWTMRPPKNSATTPTTSLAEKSTPRAKGPRLYSSAKKTEVNVARPKNDTVQNGNAK